MYKKTKRSLRMQGTIKYFLISIVLISVVAVGINFTNAASVFEPEPPMAFTFGLEVDGIMTGYFTEVTGIGSSNDVIEVKIVDGTSEAVRKLPGRLNYNMVTLKRGISSNMDLWDWRGMVEDGRIDDARANCVIIVYDATMTPIAQWNLDNVWPSQITQKISDDGGLIEEVTIEYEGEVRVQ